MQPPTNHPSDPTPLEVKPLRLPKHLADSSRADCTQAMTFPKHVEDSSRVDSTLANGSRATKRLGTNGDVTDVRSDTKAVTFQEPEDEHADDEEEEEVDYENNYDDYADYYEVNTTMIQVAFPPRIL